MITIPYHYNYYGSENSIDTDVIIDIPLPHIEEDKKRLAKYIKDIYRLDWNINFIETEKGVIKNCLYSKSSPDSINNSLFITYHNHEQDHECMVNGLVNRNIILATYKTIRQISANLTRTRFRSIIRPEIRGEFGIETKIESLLSFLRKGGFTTIETFSQQNTSDVDIWKTTAFYLGQNMALLNGIELYEKNKVIDHYLFTEPFINRKVLSDKDKETLNNELYQYLIFLKSIKFTFDGKYLFWNLDNTVANLLNES